MTRWPDNPYRILQAFGKQSSLKLIPQLLKSSILFFAEMSSSCSSPIPQLVLHHCLFFFIIPSLVAFVPFIVPEVRC